MRPPIDRVIDALREHGCDPIQSGKGWSAKCPAHDDRNPSLSIGVGDVGRVLLTCHAGCTHIAICKALGLTERDLFANSNGMVPRRSTKQTVSSPTTRTPHTPLGEIEATYPYVDEVGELLFEVVRYSDKSFHQRRPNGKGGWIWNLKDVRRVLYHLPEILKVSAASFIFIVEGEKDVDRLRSMGLIATCNSGGAGKWSKVKDAPLHRHHIVVIADNDAPGHKHARDVCRSLYGKATSVRLLKLTGLPEKGDASDWLDADPDAHDCEELVRIAEATPEWVPETDVDAESQHDWTPPQPLTGSRQPEPMNIQPLFPPALTSIRQYIEALAVAVQVPIELPAMLILPIVSVSTAQKVEIKLSPPWDEVSALWTLTLLDPGNRKSAIFTELIDPISKWEADERARLAPEIAASDEQRKIDFLRLDNLRKEAAKPNGNNAQEAQRQAVELAKTLEGQSIIVPPRIFTAEPTTEALAGILVANGERAIVASAEADALDVMTGRYTRGVGNFGMYLAGHAGDPYRIDRRGRPPEQLDRPALSMAMTCQPTAVEELFNNRQAQGRGLLDRFLKCAPVSLLGTRAINPPPVPDALARGYKTAIRWILDTPLPEKGAGPRIVKLSPEAQRLFDAFLSVLEPRLGAEGDLSGHTGWAGKLAGAVGRIALCFHALTAALSQDRSLLLNTIDGSTMTAALAWAPFLIEQERHVTGSACLSFDTRVAQKISMWIIQNKLSRFSRRDAFTALRDGNIQRAVDLDYALGLLADLAHIRPEPTVGSGSQGGRPPSPVFIVNPALIVESEANNTQTHAHNAQNPNDSDNQEVVGIVRADSQESESPSSGDAPDVEVHQ